MFPLSKITFLYTFQYLTNPNSLNCNEAVVEVTSACFALHNGGRRYPCGSFWKYACTFGNQASVDARQSSHGQLKGECHQWLTYCRKECKFWHARSTNPGRARRVAG